MKNRLLLLLFLFLATTISHAQRQCGSMEYLEQQLQQNPARQDKLDQLEQQTQRFLEEGGKALSGGILTIPVIVHVVYKNSQENISDAQIQSQMDVLTDDFRRMNADANNTPSIFASRAADTEIEFCLVQTIRVATSRSSAFGTNDAVKSASSGGSNAVNSANALNFWICDIGGGILGYAQFPGGPAATDGVVCDYRYVGTVGTATAPFDLGRTATHEVGHWLNLRHIWGDGRCRQDDFVSDTPAAGGANYTGSPCTFPGPNSCNDRTDDLPDMFQNYMDYSDDGCMNLFTIGQKDRMWAAVNAARPGLLTSACDGTPPPAVEICNNGIDDDGDGQVDCADGDCATASNCGPVGGNCDAPTGLSHSRAQGGRTANLSWNAASGATSYFVEVYSGTTLIASGTVTGTGASVSGLTKNQPYTWRIRSNCSGGAVSDWANGSFNARLANSSADAEVAIFPNPTGSNAVTVSWNLAGKGGNEIVTISEVSTASAVTISVSDLNGRLISQRSVEGGLGRSAVDLTNLAPGVYLIRVTDADGYTAGSKLVKL